MVLEKKKVDRTPMLEMDLYEPVRDYLVAQGYTVRGEVRDCDVTATKDDELIIVELKLRFNLELLYQATDRQKLSDSVYVAFPRPAKMGRNTRWKDVKRLLRRLELGLILVSFGTKKPRVEIAFHPIVAPRRKNHRARKAVIREIEGRSGDHNRGGSTRRKILTAYRENAIRIATYLDVNGPTSPKQLRAMNTGPKTQSVLYNDVYGWFERVGHALYDLRPVGREALQEYPELVAQFRDQIEGDGDRKRA
ncbi:MAG: DUF2161 family putative PD-(D/E)XK-type phosphodiesterase [Candidatus Hydrogenedentota bacterium]